MAVTNKRITRKRVNRKRISRKKNLKKSKSQYKYKMERIYGGLTARQLAGIKTRNAAANIGDNIVDGTANVSKLIQKGKENVGEFIKQKKEDIEIRNADIDDTLLLQKDEGKNLYERLKTNSASANFRDLRTGAVENTKTVFSNLRNGTDKIDNNQPLNISATAGNILKSASSSVSGLTKQVMSKEEKIKIKNELYKLYKQNAITSDEYQHSIKQINRSDGVFAIKDSIVSLLSPIQSMVQVVADIFVTKSEDIDKINPRKTIVKILRVPQSSHDFIKGKLPGAERIADEYMILTYDSFNTPAEKVQSDIRSVDNLLANVINGCVGPGCGKGEVKQIPVIEKVITITDKQNKRKQLEQLKKIYESKEIL